MKIKIVWLVIAAVATLMGAYITLNQIVIKPRVAKEVAKAIKPVKEELKSTSDSLKIERLMKESISLKADSLDTQAKFNLQQVGRLQLEIRKIAKQNKELQNGFRVDLIKIRENWWGKTLDSTYTENYR